MAVEKQTKLTIQAHSRTISPTNSPTSSTRRRCFLLYKPSTSSTTTTRTTTTTTTRKTTTSILKRRHQMKYTRPYPLKVITSRVNIQPITKYYGDQPKVGSIKFVLHGDDHADSGSTALPPPSFSPPTRRNDYYHHHQQQHHKKKQPQQTKNTTAAIPITPTSTVKFYSKVQVLKIPSKDQYPLEMKRALWGSVTDITENARRNTIEYSADGWNWQNATEESDMYIHPTTGEYIHPIHIQRLQQLEELEAKERQKKKQHAEVQAEAQKDIVPSTPAAATAAVTVAA